MPVGYELLCLLWELLYVNALEGIESLMPISFGDRGLLLRRFLGWRQRVTSMLCMHVGGGRWGGKVTGVGEFPKIYILP